MILHGNKLLEKIGVKMTPNFNAKSLEYFENQVAKRYEAGEIKGPIHLSSGNETELLHIFQYIDKNDWVFSAWRNHYHALLHGIQENELMSKILAGKSMGIVSKNPKFYSSSIVTGSIPSALGVSVSEKKKNSSRNVWCFIGDMTYETGIFWEAYKYSQNFNLPLIFVVEDNDKSVTSDTKKAWGTKMDLLPNIVHYKYQSEYPHHGTGNWVNF